MATMTYANPRHAPVRTARRLHATADMNITPMIDVLLVLLVIFMAALPLSQTGLDATVPAQAERTPGEFASGQIVVEYSAARRLSISASVRSSSDLPEPVIPATMAWGRVASIWMVTRRPSAVTRARWSRWS